MKGLAAFLCVFAAGCASDADLQPSAFDEGGDQIALCLLGDGFVTVGARRAPLDAFLLEMRQRARQLAPADRKKVLVTLSIAPDAGAGVAEQQRALYAEFEHIGITQVRCR